MALLEEMLSKCEVPFNRCTESRWGFSNPTQLIESVCTEVATLTTGGFSVVLVHGVVLNLISTEETRKKQYKGSRKKGYIAFRCRTGSAGLAR